MANCNYLTSFRSRVRKSRPLKILGLYFYAANSLKNLTKQAIVFLKEVVELIIDVVV